MPRPQLHVICGLPGSGKTTLAKRLETDLPGVRLSPDEWITAVVEPEKHLHVSDTYRDAIETLQWDLGQRMLRAGCNVIIEWGTWGRGERDKLRDEGRAAGASVHLHYLEVDPAELLQRLRARNANLPADEIFMPPSHLEEQLGAWANLIEKPNAAELATWDRVSPNTA
ncbi:MAG: ATP-binding protein [Planctomycetota bacterium]